MKTMKYLTIGLLSIGMIVLMGCRKNAGTPGKDGNANVIGTNEVTVTTWTQLGPLWKAEINVNDITSDIVDKGLVQVFKKYGPEWWALTDINVGNMTYFGYGVGYVSIMNSNANGTTPIYPGNVTFRVVIISSSNLAAHPDVDFLNYKEVKDAFNLTE